MQQQDAQDHVFILLQDLVRLDNKDSIIIFPIKTNILEDETAKRKKSETVLSDIALNGIRVSLELNIADTGKSFLAIDNKVNDYEEDPACFQGLLCKKVDEKIVKNKVNCTSTESHESSFIVYNMPYYKQDTGCFDWAYGNDLCELIRFRNEPCLVLIDEDIYNKKEDIVDEIYRRFYGKKKVFQYDKNAQKLTEYKPCFLSEIPFPTVIFWAAVAGVGLYYSMSSGLASNLDITF
jgi:hypothetical protein